MKERTDKPANLTELVTTPSRPSKRGVYRIYDDPPPPEKISNRGYPWRELAVGEAFFTEGLHLKPSKAITGCEDRKFITYAGELNGVKGRWAKRTK